MDFELDDDQAQLRELTGKLLASLVSSDMIRAAESGVDLDEELWARGAQMGWTGLLVPEEHGGAGMGLAELVLVAEQLGRSAAPGPFLETALVAHAAAGKLDPAVVAGLASGEQRGTVVLPGSPSLVHAAGSVDHLLVLRPGSAVIAPAEAARPRRRRTLDLSRGWYDIDADTGALPGAVEVASGSDATRLVDMATVLVAADLLGIGEWLLTTTVSYTSVREQFGRRIGSFQALKHKASNMLMDLKGVRAATYYAAMAIDAGTPDAGRAASVAKGFASERIPVAAGEALQIHGGIGFTYEHDLHVYLRRAKVGAVLAGDAAAHYDRVARLA